MEFLYAFKEAKKFGLSAEEFCRLWEKEAMLKRATMLRSGNARSNELLNVDKTSNNLNSHSDVVSEHSEQAQVNKSNMEELKQVVDETKDCMPYLKRDISNPNKHLMDKSMEFLCSQHLLIEKLNKQVDAINSELVNIKSKVIQGHDVKTERMKSQIADLQEEIKKMGKTFLNHTESSESSLPTEPACTSEVSVTNEMTFDSICSLKKHHILNAANETGDIVSVDSSKTSFTSQASNSHSTFNESSTVNSVTKFTGALSFLSNFVPKLVHGVLAIKEGDVSKDSSVFLHPGDDPSFTNSTLSGSSVDTTWSPGQSSVDANHLVDQQIHNSNSNLINLSANDEAVLNTNTGFNKNSYSNKQLLSKRKKKKKVEPKCNQLLVDNKLVNIKSCISTKDVNFIQMANTPNKDDSLTLTAEGVKVLDVQTEINISKKSFTTSDSNALFLDGKEKKYNSKPFTKSDESFTQTSELITVTESASPKVQKEPELTELNIANSAIRLVQESSFKKPICNLGDNYTTESNLEKYSTSIVSKPQDTPLYLIPESGVYFYMSSKQTLHQSRKTFYTAPYSTQEKRLKVRLCQYFDEIGQLCVYVLVSRGQADRSGKSVTLFGEGFIHCGYLGGYTTSRIWCLKDFQFHNIDESQELSVRAKVCLVEKKGSLKPVTFKQLVRKGYDLDGYFIFNWRVKIVKTK